MNLVQKKEELIEYLENLLSNGDCIDEINEFVWDIIDYFSDTPIEKLPVKEDFEGEFWHAVWEIQHLADDEHLKHNASVEELVNSLMYLKGQKKIPRKYRGTRP